ncbi:MAG: RNA methyltransferase [Opitutales bacterium]|nr:RNA methyltransferase [Opitutales bacterium]
MSPLTITSSQNPRIKNLIRLRDKRHRDRQKRFLIEGYRENKRALARGFVPEELFFCPEWFLGENEKDLLAEVEERGGTLFSVPKHIFAKISYRDRPDGLLGVGAQWEAALSSICLPENPLVLVVESIEKPGNLGTLLRAADAAGVDALIVGDPVTDIFNPNVVRASTGVLFSMPVAVCSTEEAIAFCQSKELTTVATTPAAETLYTDADLSGRIAIVMGSEQYGLTERWLEAANLPVRIPMAGQADSLNVAMATVITLFEAVRQRG